MDDGVHDVIERLVAGSAAFVRGDPAPLLALLSTTDDVTIFGGFGAGERGHDAVAARLAWASARFTGGDLTYEPITASGDGELGYAVGIERGLVTLAGSTEPQELALRVTHVFRREDGAWRILHRHADPITAVTPPAAIVS